ncbi:MAG: YraN family protein [Lachnospiraceae bacterium]|jgi:putative endonuclease
MSVNKRKIGSVYEDKASEYLIALGYRIVERNFRCRLGEIDIVAFDGDVLVFAEVKYRADSMESALEAITRGKREKVSKTAEYYIYKRKIPDDIPMRFDAVCITCERIKLIKNAFSCL